jgi:hypothetical protein
LKEVLDEPGARQRLIAALEPPRHRAWLWVTAAATVAVAVVVGIVVSSRTPPLPQQIAQVMKSTEPAAAPVAPPVVRESSPTPAPLRRKVAPVPVPEVAPAPPPELQKGEAENKLADQLQAAKPQAEAAARGGAAGGFGPRPAVAALRSQSQAIIVSAFAFNYAIREDGFLEIVPAAPGFLSVMTANNAVVFPSSSVSTGTPLRIPIPSDATSLVIAFSRTQGITGSPVRRDEPAGTVTDQDPPNGRITVELFLKPATQ